MEQFYQALRRAYRYGNKNKLKVFIPLTKYEEPLYQNVLNKIKTFEYDCEYQERLYKENLINDLKEYADKDFIVDMKEKSDTKRKKVTSLIMFLNLFKFLA
jgi:hypothetical protein